MSPPSVVSDDLDGKLMSCRLFRHYRLWLAAAYVFVALLCYGLALFHDERLRNSLLIVATAFLLLTALLHLLFSRVRGHYLELQRVLLSQEAVIEERARELVERNDELKREIEQRRKREHELRLAGAVFESATEAMMVSDTSDHIVRVNPAFTAITGYQTDEVEGRTSVFLRSGRNSPSFFEAIDAQLHASGRWEGEVWHRRKNGDVYVAWLSMVSIKDPEDGREHFLSVFQDITLRKDAEEMLRHRAYYDVLTDLPNRMLFHDRLDAAFSQAKRYQRAFALLMVDLDRFKEVNDTLGHPAGDELLIEAAHRLMSCVRESDTVARLGGDEFAIIITDMVDKLEADQVAQRAVELLANPYHLDAGTTSISASVGIARYPQHGSDSEELLSHADCALYEAKESGRNTYRTFSQLRQDEPQQGDLL